MKFILKNDISFLFLKEKKIISLYYIVSIILFITFSKFSYMDNKDILIMINGLDVVLEKQDMFSFMIYLFILSFYCYIIFLLFTKDARSNLENIFLRITTKKWLSLKMLSVLLITVCILFFNYLLLFLTSFLIKEPNYILFSYFFKNLLYIFMIQLLVIFNYVLFQIKQKICYLFLSGIIISIFLYPTIISILKTPLILLTCLIILYLFLLFCVNKKILLFFEKVREK